MYLSADATLRNKPIILIRTREHALVPDLPEGVPA